MTCAATKSEAASAPKPQEKWGSDPFFAQRSVAKCGSDPFFSVATKFDAQATLYTANQPSPRLIKPLPNSGILNSTPPETSACRPGCGACCIAPSISSPIPGMENGKPAGVRCVQLTAQNACKLFSDPRRPAVCGSLRPSLEMCGKDQGEALVWLTRLERMTEGPTSEPMQTARTI